MTKAYLEKGWKVIAAVRDPKSMPKLDGGEVVTIKLDAGEKEDARKVRHLLRLSVSPLHFLSYSLDLYHV